MSKIRRSFSPEDRYSILQEAIRDGHTDTCRKYNGTGYPAVPFVAAQMALEIFKQRQRRLEGLLRTRRFPNVVLFNGTLNLSDL